MTTADPGAAERILQSSLRLSGEPRTAVRPGVGERGSALPSLISDCAGDVAGMETPGINACPHTGRASCFVGSCAAVLEHLYGGAAGACRHGDRFETAYLGGAESVERYIKHARRVI